MLKIYDKSDITFPNLKTYTFEQLKENEDYKVLANYTCVVDVDSDGIVSAFYRLANLVDVYKVDEQDNPEDTLELINAAINEQKKQHSQDQSAIKVRLDSIEQKVNTVAEKVDTAGQGGTSTPETAQLMTFARMAVLPMAANMTVSEGASISKLWPERKVGDAVKLKDFFWYNNELYRCNQPELTITAGQEPDKNLPALYTHIAVAEDGILIYDADDLTGAPDIYNTGVKVHYPDADGPVYVSGRDGNTSTPGTDQWWTLVKED